MNENNKNPFEALTNFYEESVKKHDELGLAEVYKQSTELLFKIIDNYLKQEDNKLSFTPTDVEYLDGYFIFGHGTNSVVHFHIKENPEWLFGIWWNPVETRDSTEENPQYDKSKLNCELFAQFEEEIDKFKPTASTFVADLDFNLTAKEDNWSIGYHSMKAVRLIVSEPIMAWYREMHYTDFNEEYISKEEAEADYKDYKIKKINEKAACAQNDKEVMDCIKYIFGPLLEEDNAFILDQDGWSPRYEIIICNPDFSSEEDEKESLPFDDFLGEEDKKLWHETLDKCQRRMDSIEGYWRNEFSDWATILNPKCYQECKKLYLEEKEKL